MRMAGMTWEVRKEDIGVGHRTENMKEENLNVTQN